MGIKTRNTSRKCFIDANMFLCYVYGGMICTQKKNTSTVYTVVNEVANLHDFTMKIFKKMAGAM
jgi:hypothetical protein